MNIQFDSELCEKYVTSLVDHDEVERALLVLDNVPAFYRENLPDNLSKLKKNILKSVCTPHAYMNDLFDGDVKAETAKQAFNQLLRFKVLSHEVAEYNRLGSIPHIVDVGPGEFNIPMGLLRMGAKFTYYDVGMDLQAKVTAYPMIDLVLSAKPPKDQPIVFVGFEIIEHLPNPKDLVTDCLRNCGEYPERVLLSTPQYTYDVKRVDIGKNGTLPHLRAYTPHEFMMSAHELFPDYHWHLYPDSVMVLRGMRKDKLGGTIKIE